MSNTLVEKNDINFIISKWIMTTIIPIINPLFLKWFAYPNPNSPSPIELIIKVTVVFKLVKVLDIINEYTSPYNKIYINITIVILIKNFNVFTLSPYKYMNI